MTLRYSGVPLYIFFSYLLASVAGVSKRASEGKETPQARSFAHPLPRSIARSLRWKRKGNACYARACRLVSTPHLHPSGPHTNSPSQPLYPFEGIKSPDMKIIQGVFIDFISYAWEMGIVIRPARQPHKKKTIEKTKELIGCHVMSHSDAHICNHQLRGA